MDLATGQRTTFQVELGDGERGGGKGRKRDAEGRLFRRHHGRRHRSLWSDGGSQGAARGGDPLAAEARRPKPPHERRLEAFSCNWVLNNSST